MATTSYRNYKEDFSLLVDFGGEIPAYPWVLRYFTTAANRRQGNVFEASFDGAKYHNCRVVDDSHVLVLFADHHLQCGELCYEFFRDAPNDLFISGTQHLNTPECTGVTLYEGKTDGDPAPETLIVMERVIAIDVDGKVAAEAKERANADAELGRKLSGQVEAQGKINEQLSEDISSEARTRQSSDTDLAGQISSEATARHEADVTLANRITQSMASEVQAREAADKLLSQQVADKVAKIAGKGLSSEDFTTVLKIKLEGLQNYDDATIKATVDAVQRQLDTLVSGNVSQAIESFNEIEAFLSGITDAQTLAGLMSDLRTEIVALIPAVPEWSMQPTKPAYTWGEVNGKPAAFTPSAHTHGNDDLSGIADWAKQPVKPNYTATEVGAAPAQSLTTEITERKSADTQITNRQDAATEVLAHSECTLEQRIATLEQTLIAALTGQITIQNIQVKQLGVWGDNNLIVVGAGAPTIAPDRAGQMYVDTVNKVSYTSYGNSAVSDWKIK